MKKTLIFILSGIVSCIQVKAQNATAYNSYFINCNLAEKNLFICTLPKAFGYTKGSTYVFAPYSLEKLAENRIENFVKQQDANWHGLYVNQLSNGAITSTASYETALKELQNRIQLVYSENQKSNYRDKPVEIIAINLETGKVSSVLTMPATTQSTYKAGAGSAY